MNIKYEIAAYALCAILAACGSPPAEGIRPSPAPRAPFTPRPTPVPTHTAVPSPTQAAAPGDAYYGTLVSNMIPVLVIGRQSYSDVFLVHLPDKKGLLETSYVVNNRATCSNIEAVISEANIGRQVEFRAVRLGGSTVLGLVGGCPKV